MVLMPYTLEKDIFLIVKRFPVVKRYTQMGKPSDYARAMWTLTTSPIQEYVCRFGIIWHADKLIHQ